MKNVLVVDAGSGNLRSVVKALEWCGANVTLTSDAKQLAEAQKVVLPGVGAFGGFMNGLRLKNLDEGLKIALRRGAAVLGICVGMQALFEWGEELGNHEGLGLLSGRVVRFPDQLNIKIPHTGWNRIEMVTEAPLFAGVEQAAYVYFNHSYYCEPANPQDISATSRHGIRFACAVQREQLYGVQFHPEKSQKVGLTILKNFVEVRDG